MSLKLIIAVLLSIGLFVCVVGATNIGTIGGATTQPNEKSEWQKEQERRMSETFEALGQNVDIFLISGKEIDLKNPTFSNVEIRSYQIAANTYYYLVLTKNHETYRIPSSQIALVRDHS